MQPTLAEVILLLKLSILFAGGAAFFLFAAIFYGSIIAFGLAFVAAFMLLAAAYEHRSISEMEWTHDESI